MLGPAAPEGSGRGMKGKGLFLLAAGLWAVAAVDTGLRPDAGRRRGHRRVQHRQQRQLCLSDSSDDSAEYHPEFHGFIGQQRRLPVDGEPGGSGSRAATWSCTNAVAAGTVIRWMDGGLTNWSLGHHSGNWPRLSADGDQLFVYTGVIVSNATWTFPWRGDPANATMIFGINFANNGWDNVTGGGTTRVLFRPVSQPRNSRPSTRTTRTTATTAVRAPAA